MRILYVATLVAGFEDILRGKMESRGLPSFIFPLQELLNRGHQVDIILISNYRDPVNIKVDWISKDNILANINNDLVTGSKNRRLWNKVKSFFELYHTLTTCLKTGDYDFVYCHGTAALLGNILANRYQVRCGYRVYGTIGIADTIRSKGIIKTYLKYPIYGLIFNIKKEFMIVTDDGTEGNYVYKHFCRKKGYRFYFLLNGVNKNIDYSKCALPVPEEKYIFHAARICRPKGQHRVVELLHILHENGIKIHLYFAGHNEDDAYREEIIQLINKYRLNSYVIFLGDINREDLQNLARNSVAVPLFADFSNQGNVFLECAMAGAIIVTYHEPPLKRFITDGKNGYFVDDYKEAAKKIMFLCDLEEKETNAIKKRAMKKVGNKLLSWDERVFKEVRLIEESGKAGIRK